MLREDAAYHSDYGAGKDDILTAGHKGHGYFQDALGSMMYG
jgi:hypothetical protein